MYECTNVRFQNALEFAYSRTVVLSYVFALSLSLSPPRPGSRAQRAPQYFISEFEFRNCPNFASAPHRHRSSFRPVHSYPRTFVHSYVAHPFSPLITTAWTTHFWRVRKMIKMGRMLITAAAVSKLYSMK